MLDITGSEFIAIGVIAMIVIGPERLPKYAAEAARMLRQLRVMAHNARAEVSKELGPEFEDLRLSDLNPRSFVKRQLLEPIELDDLDLGLDDTPRAKPPRATPQRPLDPGARPPIDPDTT